VGDVGLLAVALQLADQDAFRWFHDRVVK
jgi:hypothetical protein